MRPALPHFVLTALLFFLGPDRAPAAESTNLQAIDLRASAAAPASPSNFKLGTARRPGGRELTVSRQSLLLDGKPWLPVMGEFHYTRYPAEEWREELLKMKAGGIDIVATYVFWIHHEEVEGVWDWSGQRDLRRFIVAARDAGLSVIVRCGPWCHGEVRNGGFPEWAVQRTDWKARSTDPKFLEKVRTLYGQIATQLRGELWKDGGPVIGIQVDNEFRGPAEYLLALKSIARDAGLDVPLYTRTGWPDLSTAMPAGEILPLYGVYAEGFWDREVTPMPGRYWSGFHFSTLRTDANIANELLGRRDAKDAADVANYPYLTCEIGGGMMNSYHRRILVDPRDIESTTLVKIGSGSTGPGYYMYHGGTNPEGKLTTLMEAQDTLATNYNDLPVKTYDFQAPLGEFGQIRPQYHTQRRLHLFLRDFGDQLAVMPTALPTTRPGGKDDVTTLRWAARSDGRAGFVFVNNYERLNPLPEKPGVQFSLQLATGGTLTFPHAPVTVPANATFFWPFNFDLGQGVQLTWATAQPICSIDEGKVRTVFFGATAGVPAAFSFDPALQSKVKFSGVGRIVDSGSPEWRTKAYLPQPGHEPAFRIETPDGGTIQIVLLSNADSLALWKGTWQGRDRVVLSTAGVAFDGAALTLATQTPDANALSIFPAPSVVFANGKTLSTQKDGVFQRLTLPLASAGLKPLAVRFVPVKTAGLLREIKNGPIKQGVPQAPNDAEFAAAAEWRIELPPGLDLARNPMLRFHYAGDVARITLDGKLLTDDFYNGNALDLGVRRFAPAIMKGVLRLAVLPLRKDAPIYLAKAAWPDFHGAASIAELASVELVNSTSFTLTAR